MPHCIGLCSEFLSGVLSQIQDILSASRCSQSLTLLAGSTHTWTKLFTDIDELPNTLHNICPSSALSAWHEIANSRLDKLFPFSCSHFDSLLLVCKKKHAWLQNQSVTWQGTWYFHPEWCWGLTQVLWGHTVHRCPYVWRRLQQPRGI